MTTQNENADDGHRLEVRRSRREAEILARLFLGAGGVASDLGRVVSYRIPTSMAEWFMGSLLCLRAFAMARYGLCDDQWDRIKSFLPGRQGQVGGTAADNRLCIEAVLYRCRTGLPWRDLPSRPGDWKVVHKRLRRWCESGVLERIFRHLASDSDNECMMNDSTIVRARQQSAGARKKGA